MRNQDSDNGDDATKSCDKIFHEDKTCRRFGLSKMGEALTNKCQSARFESRLMCDFFHRLIEHSDFQYDTNAKCRQDDPQTTRFFARTVCDMQDAFPNRLVSKQCNDDDRSK